MGKNSQRRRANGKDPGPIERAVDAAAAKSGPTEIRLFLDRKPIRLAPDGRQSVQARSNPNEAAILIRLDDGVWHGVILPPGSTFELRPSGPAAALWTPRK